ncbi:MAG: DNA polymerase III subunit delta [Burkholderiaceae bacterium]
MRLKADALAGHLAGRAKAGALARIYTVSGDEPLLAIEAQDAIRAAARAAGYTERLVLHASAAFDWSALTVHAREGRLFCERRIVEIRLPSGKPGAAGAEALRAHAQGAADDTVTIVALPRLDQKQRHADWAAALDAAGVWIDVPTVGRDALPAWIGARLARQRQQAPHDALEFIAERVEGNLLAAHQEIVKLALLYPPGALTLEQVEASVLDVARYEVFAAAVAMLEGDAARVLRIMDRLRAEGEPLPLLLWAVTEDLRTLLRLRAALDSGVAYDKAVRNVWMRREKDAAMRAALRRVDATTVARLLARCADVDRTFKGLRAPRADSDAWLELTDIALGLAAPRATTA